MAQKINKFAANQIGTSKIKNAAVLSSQGTIMELDEGGT